MKIEYFNAFTHFVFTCFGRENLIPEQSRERIEKYITGIINNKGCKLYAVHANPDHTHILLSRSPSLSEEYIATIIAENSARFIRMNNLSLLPFRWQESASAFSVSKSDVDRVCKYILNQSNHHKKVPFAEEYEKFVKFYQQTLQNE